jgi:hypothetical protein
MHELGLKAALCVILCRNCHFRPGLAQALREIGIY